MPKKAHELDEEDIAKTAARVPVSIGTLADNLWGVDQRSREDRLFCKIYTELMTALGPKATEIDRMQCRTVAQLSVLVEQEYADLLEGRAVDASKYNVLLRNRNSAMSALNKKMEPGRVITLDAIFEGAEE